jgi:hypothetical protein
VSGSVSGSFFDSIDWARPWYASVAPAAAPLLVAPDWRDYLNQAAASLALCNVQGLPLSFVPQDVLPEGTAYEAFIHAQGKVPTRENLHDFFNALVWLSFPQIKRQLNALQAAQIAALGVTQSRGPARDAATIFDENAALLVVADTVQGRSVIEGLRDHQWQRAFVEQRAWFGSVWDVWSFGHALMEKLVQPRKAITAHAWIVMVAPEFFSMSRPEQQSLLDTQVAAQLAQCELSTAAYTPLPVLGLPGWWPQQDEAFYADTHVFRPKRIR